MSEFADAVAAAYDGDRDLPGDGDENWRYGISIKFRSTDGSWRQDGFIDPSDGPPGWVPDAGELTGTIVKDLANNVIPDPDVPTPDIKANGEGIADLPPGDIRAVMFVDSALYFTAGQDKIERDLAIWPLQYDVDVFAVTDWENYEAVFGVPGGGGPDKEAIRERAPSIADEHWAPWLIDRD